MSMNENEADTCGHTLIPAIVPGRLHVGAVTINATKQHLLFAVVANEEFNTSIYAIIRSRRIIRQLSATYLSGNSRRKTSMVVVPQLHKHRTVVGGSLGSPDHHSCHCDPQRLGRKTQQVQGCLV